MYEKTALASRYILFALLRSQHKDGRLICIVVVLLTKDIPDRVRPAVKLQACRLLEEVRGLRIS